jgi:hypothetical protein
MNESLTRRISWGAKQTANAAIVSPSKKVVDDSTSDEEDGASKTSKADQNANSSTTDANGAKRRRVFDFVGTGTDAENYEDQFKQAYHDETDMEDAFATDDTKEPTLDDSDAQSTHDGNLTDQIPVASPDDSTETAPKFTSPESPPPSVSEVLGGSKTAQNASTAYQAPSTQTSTSSKVIASSSTTSVTANTDVTNQDDIDAEGSPSASPNATPTKAKKKPKKPKRNKSKSVKQMDPLQEEGEEDDDPSTVAAAGTPVAAASSTPSDTPSRKKSSSGGLMGFLKRLGGGTPKPSKTQSDEQSGSESAPVSASATSNHANTTPVKDSSVANGEPPRTPRGAKAPKVDIFEAMKAELKSFVEVERAFIHDLNMLLSEYLLPAKQAAVPIEHVAVLVGPAEQMLAYHSETLKIIEKKGHKDDHIAIGTIFDDFFASVSESYKLYRSKQVFLLSLLDSSPNNEKSMADHAAISNWLEEMIEKRPVPKQPKHIPPLQELVLEPMHRLAGLAYLLDQLTEVTPQTHPDYPNIRKAAARAHLLQTELSTRGTSYRSMAKLSEIDAMLEFPSGSPPFLLADESSKRSYLLEGPIYQLEQHLDHSQFNKIHLFLFSDMALLCKQLARDPASRSPSTVKAASSTAATSRRQNSGVRRDASGIGSSPSLMVASSNKYIVVSKLMLNHVFLVDPEDCRGEMTTFSNAKATKVSSATSSSSSSAAAAAVVEVIDPQGENVDGEERNDDVEDLKDLDCLLEIVDMGVSIHRLRFTSKEDKKLWLATFNSAVANVKMAFNVNERQYLYKLLLPQQLKPIFGALPNSDDLTRWPTAPFVASLASRQLLERLHSSTFATVNLQRNVNSLAPDTEVALIKQEVANLKREHQRHLAELNSRHEMDQEEINALQRMIKDKDVENAERNATSPTKTRRSRSSTIASQSSASSIEATPTKKRSSKKAALAVAEERAEEYLNKYLELLARDKREADLVKRLESAEIAMKEQGEHFAKTVASMSKVLERNEHELEEMKADRKKLAQQSDKLSKLIERLLTQPAAAAATTTVSASSSQSTNTASPAGNPVKSSATAATPIITPVSSPDKLARTNSGMKPPVPTKSATPKTTVSGTAAAAGGNWRGSVGSPSSGSGGASPASSPAQNNEKPVSAIPSFGARGKRPSSVSLIAAAPLDGPVDGMVAIAANSADSSESSGPPVGGGSSLGRLGMSSPNLFGSTGKSPSRLDLAGAQANPLTATANGGAGAQPPVSPGGRGKERKLKNVRFPPNGEGDSGKSGGWLRQKLGLSQPKSKRAGDDGGNASPTPWRQPPSSGGNSSDAPVTVKKPNKVDWREARAESYFSDDLGSDYDPAMAMSPSDFERAQEEFMAPDNDGSDYSDQGQ